jgi:hypothetical protein
MLLPAAMLGWLGVLRLVVRLHFSLPYVLLASILGVQIQFNALAWESLQNPISQTYDRLAQRIVEERRGSDRIFAVRHSPPSIRYFLDRRGLRDLPIKVVPKDQRAIGHDPLEADADEIETETRNGHRVWVILWGTATPHNEQLLGPLRQRRVRLTVVPEQFVAIVENSEE